MHAFVYEASAGRVVFGTGTLDRLAPELDRIGIRRPLILATPQQETLAARIVAALTDHATAVFAEARMHTPVAITEIALEAARRHDADGLVAVGGGSTIGLGKAVAIRTGLPQVAVPTTYAGSEMTPILGETQDGAKTTRRDAAIRPGTVIYDVALTLGLPAGLTVTSGLNAIAHAVEALYAADGNPVIALLAEEGIAALARALPSLAREPRAPSARADALYGAWLCGTCLGAVAMGLHHKLCHVLGGSFDLPHAETHTVVLPHACAYNAAAAPEAMARIARALGTEDAPGGLFDLAASLGAPTSLRAIGMPADGLDRAADLAVRTPYPNPRHLDRAALRALLDDAFAGRRPSSHTRAPETADA